MKVTVKSVKVKYYGSFIKLTGIRETSIHTLSATVGELIRELCLENGTKFLSAVFNDDGSFSPNAVILLNSSNIFHLEGGDTPLRNSDIIQFLPVVAGG